MNTSNALACYIKAGAVVKRALARAHLLTYAGMPVIELAEFIEKDIKRQGALPAFPVCLALNNEVAYHTPSRTATDVLHSGDLLKVDVGAHVSGYIVDTAVTWEISETPHAPPHTCSGASGDKCAGSHARGSRSTQCSSTP